ncbi:MAG: GspE/PulE family protein [Lentisphaeria bacterium]
MDSEKFITSRVLEELLMGLVASGKLTEAQIIELNSHKLASQQDVEDELKSRFGIREEDILLALASYTKIPLLNLADFEPNAECLSLLNSKFMQDNNVLPIAKTARTLTLALSDPLNILVIQKVYDVTKLHVIPVAALDKQIKKIISGLNSKNQKTLDEVIKSSDSDENVEFNDVSVADIAESDDSTESVPVIRIVNMILMEAIRKGASDIHIEPFDKSVRLRYRIDGALNEATSPPKNMQLAIASRVKVMSRLDIAERRIPQDGKFRIKAGGKELDFRVSSLPTVHGEKLCLRLLDKGNLKAGLDDLGLDPDSLIKLKLAVANPHGLILVTGPTGSGKTTTLYSCLQELNKSDVNIVTVENPVEYQLEGINQVEINDKAGMTFSAALRSILRQDPDIVLVGETRDNETAEIAVKAALTGHLVMTTLHTNSAPGAITRLADMGIAPFLLSSSVLLAQAQRLVKTICPSCKQPVTTLDEEFCRLNHIPLEMFEGQTLYEGKGCGVCGGSGYKGRASIMEIIVMTPKIREMVLHGSNGDELAEAARIDQDFKTLQQAGYRRVIQGVTTLQEVMRVAAGDH